MDRQYAGKTVNPTLLPHSGDRMGYSDNVWTPWVSRDRTPVCPPDYIPQNTLPGFPSAALDFLGVATATPPETCHAG